MDIIVNHVTRMSLPRICVAGIDAATRATHVRPVSSQTDPITRDLLRENGGPFRVGALVNVGPVIPCPNMPETEDHEFRTTNLKRVTDVGDAEYLEVLQGVCEPDIHAAFGPDLVEVRPGKFAVPAGRGTRSLAVMRVRNAELRISYDRLYLHLDSPHPRAKLRVTDVRFYDPDHETLRRAVVDDVNSRLKAVDTVYAMLGLARAMNDSQAGDVHWLMANGLCLSDRPVDELP